ncbi:hypothetical protein UFOVP1299_80 [uncultured Caudovirales phage]|uniref:Uncharacterized protein n=1 Tax=uncultured Caudovirales phage TaxID=2100421 RepID=A0A6J5RHE2_9CAUD|nr:hypothetical protein UFOVP1299_80 [uncultured Caudovirales phage]
MAKEVYEQHLQSFNGVSAYVVTFGGERAATISFKYARTGGVICYLHWICSPMVRGRAGGGGYDKATAALEEAFSKLNEKLAHEIDEGEQVAYANVLESMKNSTGGSWEGRFKTAGFEVLRAI